MENDRRNEHSPKPFYTVRDIAKELKIPAYEVSSILKQNGIQRAKTRWRISGGKSLSEKKVPMHFTPIEYRVVKGIVERSFRDVESSGTSSLEQVYQAKDLSSALELTEAGVNILEIDSTEDTDILFDYEGVNQKLATLPEKYPEVELHLTAVKRLQLGNRSVVFTDDDQDALVLFSVWTEDPLRATEVAQDLGLSENEMYRYVDAVTYDPDQFGERLLEIVGKLRPKSLPPQNLTSAVSIPISEREIVTDAARAPSEAELMNIVGEAKTIISEMDMFQGSLMGSNAEPLITRTAEYRDEPVPFRGQLAQSYDHPILTRGQEYAIFTYLRSGTPIEEVRRDESFVSTFDPDDQPKIKRILAQSDTVEGVISSCNLRLVDVIARGYNNSTVTLRDRINAGNNGLIDAIRKWDHTQGRRFSSYSVWSIRSAVGKEVYQQRSSVRIPTYVQLDLSKARWVSGAFYSLFGRNPTMEELRKQLLANTDIPQWRVNTVVRVIASKIQHISSINQPMPSEDGESEYEIADFIPDKLMDVEGSAVQRIADEELRKETRQALQDHLTEEERHVMKVLYGLDVPEKTSVELGTELGMTKDEVENVERLSLLKLRRDRRLRERWQEDMPSFLYRMSAERAAFRLGLFEDDEEPVEIPSLEASVSVSAKAQSDAESTKEVRIAELDPLGLYRDTLSTIPLKSGVEITLEGNETLDEIRASVIRAAEETGRAVDLVTLGRCNILVQIIEILPSVPTTPIHEVREKSEIANDSSEQVREITGPVENETDRKSNTIIAKVKRLRNQGFDNQQIQELLGISYNSVVGAAKKLLKRGEITAHRPFGHGGNSRDIGEYVETPLDEADDEAIRLVRQYLEAQPRPSYRDSFRRFFNRKPRPNERKPETIEFDAKVKALREQGVISHKEAAEALQTSTRRVQAAVERLTKAGEVKSTSGRTPETIKFRNQVEQLRNLGLDNTQVAARLDAKLSRVQQVAGRLIRTGSIKPIKVNPPEAKAKAAGAKEFKEQVRQLRLQGLNNRQIAEALRDTIGRVERTASNLIKAGEIEVTAAENRAPTRVGVVDRNYVLPQHPDYSRVAQLRDQGLSIRKIAETLDIPYERVRLISGNLIRAGVTNPRIATTEEAEKRRMRVTELKRQGFENTDIAWMLDESVDNIRYVIKTLKKQGVNLGYNQESIAS